MDGLLDIILWEGLDFALVTGATFTGQESERSVTRCFKFAMRLIKVSVLMDGWNGVRVERLFIPFSLEGRLTLVVQSGSFK